MYTKIYSRCTKYTFVIISFLLIFLSCQKADVVLPMEDGLNTDLYSIQDGQLSFKSTLDFKTQLDRLMKMSPADLLAWNDQTKVNSVLESQLNSPEPNPSARVNTEQKKVTISDVLYDPVFASLLNSDGEMRIGNMQIRITPDVVFIGNMSRVSEIRQKNPEKYQNMIPNKHITEDGIIIGKVSHLGEGLRMARVAFNGIDHSIYNWDDRHRSATVIYNDNWLVYRSIGCKVKFQNKRWWGAWIEQNTDRLHLEYDVVYDISTLPTVTNFIHITPNMRDQRTDCTDCSSLDDVIDWSTLTAGIGDGGFITELISDPFSFESLAANSRVVWGGNSHWDYLIEYQ